MTRKGQDPPKGLFLVTFDSHWSCLLNFSPQLQSAGVAGPWLAHRDDLSQALCGQWNKIRLKVVTMNPSGSSQPKLQSSKCLEERRGPRGCFCSRSSPAPVPAASAALGLPEALSHPVEAAGGDTRLCPCAASAPLGHTSSPPPPPRALKVQQRLPVRWTVGSYLETPISITRPPSFQSGHPLYWKVQP